MAFAFIPSDQTQRIKPSATLAVNALATKLAKEGHDVVKFTLGEPDKSTPESVGKAMSAFALKGQNKYAAPMPELNAAAVIAKFKRDNGLIFTPDQVTAGVGGKELVFWGIGAYVNSGDRVVIPAPYWVSYPEIVAFFGGTTEAIVPSQENLKITPDELRRALKPGTKLFILNQPSNPAGVVYNKQELSDLAVVLREAVATTCPNLAIITDDIYEKLVYGMEFHTLPQIAPDLAERTLVINGLSKSHAFTGARYGYCAGHPKWIATINKMISQSSTHGPTIVQAGALAALQEPENFLVEWRADYLRRRDYVLQELKAMGIPCARPDGAFYVFPNISGALGKESNGVALNTDEDFVLQLLKQKYVGLVHGSAFGMAGYARISYATSDDNLKKGLTRIGEFWRGLRQRSVA